MSVTYDLHIRIRDEELAGALRQTPTGKRQQVVVDALRLVLLGAGPVDTDRSNDRISALEGRIERIEAMLDQGTVKVTVEPEPEPGTGKVQRFDPAEAMAGQLASLAAHPPGRGRD